MERAYSFISRNYESIYWIKNCKNSHFSTKNGPKMALNGQNSQFFYIDPIWLCLLSIQLIGMRLFFYIKELRVDLLNKTLKMALFQPKMAQKWPVLAKIPNFFYWSNLIMPYEYPVNWNALILLYQGSTSRFIEKKTKKWPFFNQKWPKNGP